MENGKSTDNLTSRGVNDNSKVLLIGSVAVAFVFSVISIIVALVSLSVTRSIDINVSTPYTVPSSSSSSGSTSDKIWLLAFSDSGVNYGYIDDVTGELKGFSIDMANTVCQIANKNCQMVYDSPQRCWDSQIGARPQGGEGLFGGYYDACVGTVHTYDRPRTFRFSDPYTDNLPPAVLITPKGNPHNFAWEDLTGKKIGFLDGFAYDEHCLARTNQITGKDLSTEQIIHYSTRMELQQGLRDNEVDAIFDAKRLYVMNNEFDIVSDDILTCFKAGFSVMTRKDNRLIDWWNPAFAKLTATSQWQAICNDLTDEHGHVGGGDATSCVGI